MSVPADAQDRGGGGPGAAQGRGGDGAGAAGAGRGAGRGGGGGPGAAAGRGGGRGGRGGAYTPPAGSRELKDVLHNWTWHMGMLRGEAEQDLVITLDYHAEGTVQVDGQPCTLTKYRINANYQSEGYRNQIQCTRANGQTYSNVENVSSLDGGVYAWDDDIPGAEIVAGQGKSTPKPETVDERLIRLWASPHGAPKAAIAGAAGMKLSESLAQNPGQLLERQATAGVQSLTTLEWQGNKPVVTYPIPGVAGAVATATLREDFLPERVVVRHGANTYEFVYGDFKDLNNPLHRIEALYAGTIVERRNGTVTRDLRSVETEIGNVYVVVPVPKSVRDAGPAKRY